MKLKPGSLFLAIFLFIFILSGSGAAGPASAAPQMQPDAVRIIVQTPGDPPVQPLGMGIAGAELHQQEQDFLAEQRDDLITAVEKHGIDPQAVVEYEGAVFNGFAMTVQPEDLAAIEALVGEGQVYEDFPVYATLVESVPKIGASALWAMQDGSGAPVNGEGITVAVIDTGINYMHQDLGGCLGDGCKVIGGWDYVYGDGDPMDDSQDLNGGTGGHGTHVAGIIAASGGVTGVAPAASLRAYKVLDRSGSGSASNTIKAIEQAVLDGADVINLSLGGQGSPDDPVSQAVDRAVQKGVFVVAAAGNTGSLGYGSLASPGVARQAFTVAAAARDDHIAWFSSLGPVLGHPELNKPDITAPGTGIVSTKSIDGATTGTGAMDGTSMAAPHISGAAALLLQLHPDWSPQMLRSALAQTAVDLGELMIAQGAGQVRVDLAANTALMVAPSNVGFGSQALGGRETVTLRLANQRDYAVSVDAVVSVQRILEDSSAGLRYPTAVDGRYAALSQNAFSMDAHEEVDLPLQLTVPMNAQHGYYEGVVRLEVSGGGTSATLRVPFSFWLSSQVYLPMLVR